MMKETVKLNHFSTPFYLDFPSLPQGVQETPAQGSQFVTKFLSGLKLVIYKIYSRHQSDFPFRI